MREVLSNGAAAVRWFLTRAQLILALLAAACSGSSNSNVQGTGLNRVNHIIIVMLENHSFDNYLGSLAYAPGGPYHPSSVGCAADDHRCVDGLSCLVDPVRGLACTNSNPDDDRLQVTAFHATSRCTVPDLAHSWTQSHLEASFDDPNATLSYSPDDGFVRVNDAQYQPDNGVETATEDPTMGFYTQDDLPFYYDLAENFAIDDRYFASVMGPTLPNRLYEMAATSFGHMSGSDSLHTGEVFKPQSGSILDLLDSKGISWTNFTESGFGGEAMLFRQPGMSAADPHFRSLQDFLAAAMGSSAGAELPQVSWVSPGFKDNEHPPNDIQLGQAFVSAVVNAVRGGPYWKDSVVFITYDEHGGFYDHVAPPPAPQEAARTPDGLFPGQCADLSNPPASQRPGAGADCSDSTSEAQSFCPDLARNPAAQYPDSCASFDQLGFRVPLVVVSPFVKPHYVSHTVADHTSLLAFIEERFLNDDPTVGGPDRLHLTLRDQYANTIDDLFDFENAPSLNTPVIAAQPPAIDCTPRS
jgi:phospholipase C